MAQAHIEKRPGVTLSKHTTVRVTDNGQIEFTVTPSKEFMPKTFVYLSGPAWSSLVNNAVQKINETLNYGAEESWMYHPNSKYVTVTESKQVFLQTYNRKGNLMNEHSVFLTPEEWENLNESISLLNMEMDKVLSNKQKTATSLMTTYTWRFESVKGGQEHSGFARYLDKDTATEAAKKYQLSCPEQLGKLKLDVHLERPLNPFKFIMVVYFTILYRMSKRWSVWIECTSDLKQCFIDNYDTIIEMAEDTFVVSVFQKCWKKMGLPIVDGPALYSHLHIMIEAMDCKDLMAQKVLAMGKECHQDTECILVSSVCKEMDLEGRVSDKYDEMSEKGLITPLAKKAKNE